jgi:hypothetical protein
MIESVVSIIGASTMLHAAILALALVATQSPAQEKPFRVYFVGNSGSAVNDRGHD